MPATRPKRVVVTGTLLLLLGVAACSSSSSSSSSSTRTSASLRGGSSSSSTSLPSLSCGRGALATQGVASVVVDAVVNITVTLSQGESADSGMIVSPTGEALTTNHAIVGATSIKVVIGGRGATHTAHVLGYDVVDDIALLQIDGVSNLKTVPFGDSAKVKVGGLVVAIGNDSGGGPPVSTRGKITAINRQTTAGLPGGATSVKLYGAIQSQLNVPVAGGGGPLVNAQGDVIGMNDAQDSDGASFAIPINEVATVVAQICHGNTTNRVHIGPTALLGVQINNSATTTTMPGAGHSAQSSSEATVISVESNSAAAIAGIKTGDVITSINGKSITNSDALHLALTLYHPGDRVNVGWVDTSGARHAAVVMLGVGAPG